MLETVAGLADLRERTRGLEDAYVVGFFGAYSHASQAAEREFQALAQRYPQVACFSVDTARVKDVHAAFGVDAVPAVLRVLDGKAVKRVLGAAPAADYDRLLAPPAAPGPRAEAGAKAAPAVTVYSTPSCSWCVAVKAYLKERGVRFTEVNVAADEKKAQALVKRTGQTGVPQLKIGAAYVVGFDRPRIDALLGL